MSTNGPGSCVNIPQQMRVRGELEGWWVSSNVMHWIKTRWVTFSAHMYHHHYPSLFVIFTCELRAEDPLSLESAWRLMLEVASDHNVEDPIIDSFSADNAQARWIAIINDFFRRPTAIEGTQRCFPSESIPSSAYA